MNSFTGLDGSRRSKRVKIDRNELREILQEYWELPAKYRAHIWQKVLQLPGNGACLAKFLKKGKIHSAYEKIAEHYPLENKALMSTFQRVCSALACWCPIFAAADYLPVFIFPFVHFLRHNILAAFETVVTIIVNLCGDWFEYWPQLPFHVLASVESLLLEQDSKLVQHFRQHKITTAQYAWPLLSTALSEVLTKDEWLCIWDHILVNPSSFFICIVVSYNILLRNSIFLLSTSEEFKLFYGNENALDIRQLLKKAYTIHQSLSLTEGASNFTPLPTGSYPMFTKFPVYSVNRLIAKKEEIQKEETQLEHEEEQLQRRKTELETLEAEERRLIDVMEHLAESETMAQRLIEDEEKTIGRKKSRLSKLRRSVSEQEQFIPQLEHARDLRHSVLSAQQRVHALQSELMRKRREAADLASGFDISTEMASRSSRLQTSQATPEVLTQPLGSRSRKRKACSGVVAQGTIFAQRTVGILCGLNHGSVSHQITSYYAVSSGYKLKVKVPPVPKLQSTGRTHQNPIAVRTGSKKWTPGVPVYKVPMEDQEVMVEDSGESKQVTREVLTRINEQIKDHSHSRLFAVVKMASWQYKVTVNDLIAPQIWLEADIGDRIVLEKVLLVGGREWSLIGQPILPKDLVRIEATVVEKTLTHTFTSFFMIKRKRHRRMHFFKYPLAVLRINSIEMKRPLHSP
ncbi:unnamed protein product [Darwinula stevensoni]|uniref:Rab-GAP TBC domain-containing protein n=1 Tax=Darwinula stevensoni TaxID=69355 RepID=A0A7R8ZZK8_9CRUS|nr:unnamed protein product [Darwinula stevensoni]CAG0883875.1 unnamed protein product [Darwinula stevensoni]